MENTSTVSQYRPRRPARASQWSAVTWLIGIATTMALFLVAPTAQAAVYKCQKPGGEIVYQSSPCTGESNQVVLEERKGDDRWEKVTSWEWGIVYYDPSRFWRAGDHVMLWLLYDLTDSASERFLKERYRSVVFNETIDCRNRTKTVHSYVMYDGQMAHGKVVRRDSSDESRSLSENIDGSATFRVISKFCQVPNSSGRRYYYDEDR